MKEFFKLVLRVITNRLLILAVIMSVLFVLIVQQLFDLQIQQGMSLDEDFTLEVIKERAIEGQRGSIFDRNGYPLAENVLAYTVQLDGSIYVPDKNKMILELTNSIEENGDTVVEGFPIGLDINGNLTYQVSSLEVAEFKRQIFNNGLSGSLSEEEQSLTVNDMYAYVAFEMFELTEVDTYERSAEEAESKAYTREDILKILNIRYPLWLKRYNQYILSTVAVNISEKTLAVLEENADAFPGITIIEDPLRQYNDAKYFSHIIGYTREINGEQLEELKPFGYDVNDIVGVTGIENIMELTLHGADGVEKVEVDNLGRTMSLLTTEEPSVGDDVYLTLDKDLQIESYEILEKQLANVIQSKLVYAKEADSLDISVKQVFQSLIDNDIIDVLKIESSELNTAGRLIYNVYYEAYNKTVTALSDYLESETVTGSFTASS